MRNPLGKHVRDKFVTGVWLGIASILLVSSSALASDQRHHSAADEEAAVRAVIAQWVDAYQALDARRIAALETPDVQIVDRFGDLHRPSGTSENEKLWSEAFQMVRRDTTPAKVTIDRIQFLTADVALVQATWKFGEGILLVDGDSIPPFSQVDTYVVIKSHGVWLIAAHNMQERKP